MAENETKGVIDPRLNSFRYNFNTTINYRRLNGRNLDKDLKKLREYTLKVKAQVDAGTAPENLVLEDDPDFIFEETMRDLVYSGLKDEVPGITLADVGRMFTQKALHSGILAIVIMELNEGALPNR